jgi:NhaC family Na+:H+ antiporter
VGIALVGIGSALGISSGMIAGAVISGAYFGDKMSPLSDTTNLAPAMAGTDLFTHIKYMTFTTVPSIVITLLFFTILSFNMEVTGSADIDNLLVSINSTFSISLTLFIVPGIVIVLILLKTKPLIALGSGVLLAAVFAFIFQGEVLDSLGDSRIETILTSIYTDTAIVTENTQMNDLYNHPKVKSMVSFTKGEGYGRPLAEFGLSKKPIIALGGISINNLKKLNLTNCYGFAGISIFE